MKFQEILEAHGVPVAPSNHEHSRPGWVQFDCPHCSRNWKHYRMGYNIARHFVNCWACGRHQLIETVMAVTDKSFEACVGLLKQIDRVDTYYEKPKRGNLVLPKGLEDSLPVKHRNYLLGRRFDPQHIQQLWGVKAISIQVRLKWRLFIPIILDDEVVSWTTRSVVDGVDQRYLSASPSEERVDHKTILYGEDYVRHGIIVCEGPTDVWRVGPGAVCTFGTSFSDSQVLRISKYPVRAICYDNSPDAQRAASDLCDRLMCFPGETSRVVLDAKDPGTAKGKEIRELRGRFLGETT